MTRKEQERADTNYTLKSITLTASAFKLLSEKERNDLSICLLAIDKDPENYRYVGENLLDNTEIITATLNIDGYMIKYMPDHIKRNNAFCRIALTTNGLALEVLPKEIQTEDLAVIAINNHPAATQELTEELKKSISLARRLYKETDTNNYLVAFPLLNKEAQESELSHFIPQLISSEPNLMKNYKAFVRENHPIYNSPLAIELYKELTYLKNKK